MPRFMTLPTNPIAPMLWCDHGQWQAVRDETCLYLPRIGSDSSNFCFRGQPGYWFCRVWCLTHGYGWLPADPGSNQS